MLICSDLITSYFTLACACIISSHHHHTSISFNCFISSHLIFTAFSSLHHTHSPHAYPDSSSVAARVFVSCPAVSLSSCFQFERSVLIGPTVCCLWLLLRPRQSSRYLRVFSCCCCVFVVVLESHTQLSCCWQSPPHTPRSFRSERTCGKESR